MPTLPQHNDPVVPSTAAATTAAAPTAPASIASAVSAPAATQPATPATPAASPSAASAVATPCGDRALTVTEAELDGGLGHFGVVLVSRNAQRTRCTVTGYPGVAGLDGTTQREQATRSPRGYLGGVRSGSSPRVTLAPGGTASAIVEGTDVPAGTSTACPPLSGLLVTPPGSHVSTRLTGAPLDCSGLAVHPVVPGTSGNHPAP